MAQSYLEMIQKLQAQGLEALKQAQEAHVAALSTVRDMASAMPTMTSLPKFEDMPSMSAIAETNSAFATSVLEQQKAYAAKLAGLFDTAQHDVKVATDRVVNATTAPVNSAN